MISNLLGLNGVKGRGIAQVLQGSQEQSELQENLYTNLGYKRTDGRFFELSE